MELLAGLRYVPNYISDGQAAQLIELIDAQPWNTDMKRHTQHYGYFYDYKRRQIDESVRLGDLPAWGYGIAKRLYHDGFMADTPDQLLVNQYLPGQGVAPHVDCEPCFTDTIISLSLGSAAVMDFCHIRTEQRVSMLLEPNSLLILRGEARYDWQHSIAARKTDFYGGAKLQRERRLSMTFRKVILNA